MTDFLDFNDAPIAQEPVKRLSAAEVKERLLERLPQYIEYLLPQAKGYSDHYAVGDRGGAEGQSLKITITGDKKGLWHDFATGENGDMFHLTQANQHIDFPEALKFVARWLGVEAQLPKAKSTQSMKKAAVEDLGPHTAKWDYLNTPLSRSESPSLSEEGLPRGCFIPD